MNQKIISLIAAIDEFKGYWHGLRLLSTDRLNALKVLATIESIGSSTRIEGSLLSDNQVSTLLQGLDIDSFRTRDDQEVAGYAEAIGQIHENFVDIELTENNIKQLHKSVLKFSEKDNWHLGEYKKHPNHVVAYDSEGKQIGIIFKTASPFDTPRLMERLVSKAREEPKNESHPLLIISDFVLRFLAIHPFQDGNGRLSRILTNLILLRNGYEFVMYSSHERIIEANKENYYKALRASQGNIKDDSLFHDNWTEFFLNLLKKQTDELKTKIHREKLVLATSVLSTKIMDLTQQHGRVSVAFICKTLEVNRNTVKKHLQMLVQQNQLSKQGQGRGTYYILL